MRNAVMTSTVLMFFADGATFFLGPTLVDVKNYRLLDLELSI
jgi:hypothetical protein